MIIGSFDRFGDVATFDPARGILNVFDRPPSAEREGSITSGHYSVLNDRLVVFFRAESGDLTIWVEGQSFPASESSVQWVQDQDRSILSVHRGAGNAIELSYHPDRRAPDDPTPFVDDEDEDFGLFIKNVISDEPRRNRIYGGTQSP